ncbi:MAG: pyridoxal phosphate-dependent aminotransferase, partial [Acidobacteria bacterium]|nr:pyridoxal phosphate-dependent aminotransferase [Acidobacteriota bacterium]
TIDVASVARALSPRTRAILVVSPNNPTGSFADADGLGALGGMCAARSLALIGDEVFADYVVRENLAPPPGVLADPAALTFGLGGLSKSAGLPQLKLGWIGIGGPAPLVVQAVARLEVIADTYLSVSTPVQLAAGHLITAGGEIRSNILERIRRNHRQLEALVAAHPSCTLLPIDGGWSAVIQVPATRPEETLVLELLEEDHVLVHPGYFFDFPREAFVVVSLLPPPDAFRDGMSRVLRRAATGC